MRFSRRGHDYTSAELFRMICICADDVLMMAIFSIPQQWSVPNALWGQCTVVWVNSLQAACLRCCGGLLSRFYCSRLPSWIAYFYSVTVLPEQHMCSSHTLRCSWCMFSCAHDDCNQLVGLVACPGWPVLGAKTDRATSAHARDHYQVAPLSGGLHT